MRNFECCGDCEMEGEMRAVMDAIFREIGRAEAKHPDWPTHPLHQLVIVQEELGEVTKEVLEQFEFLPRVEAGGNDGADVYEATEREKRIDREMTEVAAMAIRFLVNRRRTR